MEAVLRVFGPLRRFKIDEPLEPPPEVVQLLDQLEELLLFRKELVIFAAHGGDFFGRMAGEQPEGIGQIGRHPASFHGGRFVPQERKERASPRRDPLDEPVHDLQEQFALQQFFRGLAVDGGIVEDALSPGYDVGLFNGCHDCFSSSTVSPAVARAALSPQHPLVPDPHGMPSHTGPVSPGRHRIKSKYFSLSMMTRTLPCRTSSSRL